jgi:hypothetical protein
MEGINDQMTANCKRPYKHILKNLFHEQAREVIPVLWPDYQIEEFYDVEMPDIKSTRVNRPPTRLEQGVAELAVPEGKVVEVYKTEWIENSGHFERAYRFSNSDTNKPCFLVVEFQLDPNDGGEIAGSLMSHFIRVDRYAAKLLGTENEMVPAEGGGTLVHPGHYVYPMALCRFPQNVPAPIRDEFRGRVLLAFNFQTLCLWEKDAREVLNTQVSAAFFLLPAMKNVDAPLLGLAIDTLAQKFKDDETELGRHLTGMNMMLQDSDTLSPEEKLAAQEHLKRFAHLIKDDPTEE